MRRSMPLSFIKAGETVALDEIRVGQVLGKRLGDLGLNVGMTVRVMQTSVTGPMILAVKNDARLAIERSIAQKILVIPQGS